MDTHVQLYRYHRSLWLGETMLSWTAYVQFIRGNGWLALDMGE
jgi:hypothetical protein